MLRPPSLQKGDTVGIVSTARKITSEELAPFIELLASWDLNAVLGKTINVSYNQFAGNDRLRAEDFQEMMDNPEIKAIWCARGGYGTVRMVDQLEFATFRSNPKWIIGYSDVTVLHSHIHSLSIETLHANMAMEFDIKSAETRESARDVLFGKKYEVRYISEENKHHRNGKVRGQVVGGNLSLLYSLIGSPSQLDTAEKILFIEDLDEYLYHIDRMMQNLKRNGLLAKLKGLIVGGMSDMNDNTIPFGKTAHEIIAEAVAEYDYPVCFNFPAGHIADNRALILGGEATLTVENNSVTLHY